MAYRKLNKDGTLINYSEKSEESLRKITLKFPLARDYHPEAMIYALKRFGFKVEDSKEGEIDSVDKSEKRTVSVYI